MAVAYVRGAADPGRTGRSIAPLGERPPTPCSGPARCLTRAAATAILHRPCSSTGCPTGDDGGDGVIEAQGGRQAGRIGEERVFVRRETGKE
jgi:hypothetical protein